MSRTARVMLVLCVAIGSSAAAQELVVDLPGMDGGPDPDCAEAVHGRLTSRDSGRRIVALSSEECLGELDARGVSHRAVSREEAPGVAMPMRLESGIAGVELTGTRERVIDCRLALALSAWAPALRDAGIRGMRVVSIHRPGARVSGSGRVSGHASALAIDVGAFVLEDGTEATILNGWEARERGAAPCGAFDEGPRSAQLRRAVCEAVRSDRFHIVLTPHYDHAHRNHVHLELVPGVSWSYVR